MEAEESFWMCKLSQILNFKQLLDEVYVISGIIKVEVSAGNIYRDLGYSEYHKNLIQALFYYTLFSIK